MNGASPAPAFDVIIVGAGSAGCALANRLSADPGLSVLLIEAGPKGAGPFTDTLVNMPRGVARTMANSAITSVYRTTWPYTGAPEGGEATVVRGRMLGGSSTINGMIYHRGQPQDYDRWAELGNAGWGWADLLPYFKALEDHETLPATEWRGKGGAFPLRLMPPSPLAEAVIEAAGHLGLPRKEEPNLREHCGISYLVANIDRHGRRVSAARAFLPPDVRRRPNLHIVADTRVERLRFDGRRCVGVQCVRNGVQQDFTARAEVILSGGAYESPLLLQASGIGPASHLAGLGIPLVSDNDNVGRNMRDHWQYHCAYTLVHPRDSENREFRGWRLGGNLLRYFALGNGPLATATHHLAGFLDTEGEGRATVQFIMGPYTAEVDARGRMHTSAAPTMNFYCTALRGTSEGSVMIGGGNGAAPIIRPNYLATDYDRRVTLAGARFLRKLAATEPLAQCIAGERAPAAGAETDEELLAAARRGGSFSAHTCGTCRMGPDDDPRAVVDPRLRVRGVEGLRVVDCSIFPEMISANTNGPVMAVALRAADLILEDLHRA